MSPWIEVDNISTWKRKLLFHSQIHQSDCRSWDDPWCHALISNIFYTFFFAARKISSDYVIGFVCFTYFWNFAFAGLIHAMTHMPEWRRFVRRYDFRLWSNLIHQMLPSLLLPYALIGLWSGNGKPKGTPRHSCSHLKLRQHGNQRLWVWVDYA